MRCEKIRLRREQKRYKDNPWRKKNREKVAVETATPLKKTDLLSVEKSRLCEEHRHNDICPGSFDGADECL